MRSRLEDHNKYPHCNSSVSCAQLCTNKKQNTKEHKEGRGQLQLANPKLTLSGPMNRWGLVRVDGCSHVPCVTQERTNQELQFSIVLSHGAMGSVPVSVFQRFPSVDDINVALADFLFQRSSVRCPTESSIHLNPLSQRFLVQDGCREQFAMSVKEVFEDF
jgi:hypothetical protein